MASCSFYGCTAGATCKCIDYRRRRGVSAPTVRLGCDYHAQHYARTPGVKVIGLVDRSAGSGRGERIDLKAALRRLGKLRD